MRRTITGILLLALLLSACGAGGDAEDKAACDALVFTDDLGRSVAAPAKPARVAALIGSFAEVWCLAGGADTLAAAADDAWTSFDLGLGQEVANLGAVKQPSLETLLASEPDFVLASVNTAADLELEGVLSAAGIPAAYFDVQSFEDYLNMLDICTRLTGERENYEKYGLAVREEIDAAKERADGSAPTVLVIRATGVSCKVKASQDSVAGEMLRDLGCVNVADSDAALLESLSLEAIIAAEPDYIFAVLQGSDPERAMETLGETENRYSGIPTVRRIMREEGRPDPVFESFRGEFRATLANGHASGRSAGAGSAPQNGRAGQILSFCSVPRSREEIAEFLGIGVNYASARYVNPLVKQGLLAMTIPETPRSHRQRFVAVGAMK